MTTTARQRSPHRGSRSVVAAMAGAGVAAAIGAQVAAPGAQAHAEASIANIPTNIYQTLANIPAVQYQALQQTTKAFNDSGNWWVYIPTNVVGFDQQDYEKVKAISLLLMPVPLVANAQSDQLWMTLASFAPMTPNCTGVPGPCSDPLYFLQYGQVPAWELVTGYTFPEISNTIDPNDATYTTADGTVVNIQPFWSGETVHLDLLGPLKAVWETLTQDPTGVQQGPTTAQWASAYGDFAEAVWNGLNPFVPGTYCLPCQLFGAQGAPGSLPKFGLFGKYYTAFDLGQQLTDGNWVENPAPGYDDPDRPDYVQVTNLWTAQAWQQIYTDAVTSVDQSLAMIPQLPTLIPQNLEAFGTQVDAFAKLLAANVVTNINGLGQAAGMTGTSAEQLAEMIRESILNAVPTAGSAAGSTGTTTPALAATSPTTAVKSSVTLSSEQALRGTSASVTPTTTTSTSSPSTTGTTRAVSTPTASTPTASTPTASTSAPSTSTPSTPSTTTSSGAPSASSSESGSSTASSSTASSGTASSGTTDSGANGSGAASTSTSESTSSTGSSSNTTSSGGSSSSTGSAPAPYVGKHRAAD
ncbi:hypothetical protein [Gordonia polyisoprenivorans]|uniref:hypothetical protein n=1 Tax=Gordonia polyisoprenivorans TaxID=84595 RepID=UPI0023018FA1|nr:hypothetical protein [Gordonia polyisoprenivorans]WCB39574.1 hypothetical protein PHA63_10955 [Gordonia polyisoprenivorans]